MSMYRRALTALGVVAAIALGTGTASAQNCDTEKTWQQEHKGSKAKTITTDVKGSRNTDIEVCRTAEASGKDLAVEVLFEGSKTPSVIAEGECANRFTRWAIVRSKGMGGADGSATVVKGTYKICRE